MSKNIEIPFNRPFIAGKELFYISQAVVDGHLAGGGVFSRRCQQWMEHKFSARKVLLTHSCTAALEMAALLAGIEPGDEVIMPSFTFVSTANAFALHGAQIRFVDIRPDTLNIDERLIEAAITDKTKAIVPVHYAGVACEMDTICEIAKRHDLMVIEDAAQGVNATYKGRYLGTLGHLGTFSFHETKNFIAGEGGALLVNDENLIDRAEIIREKGTNRAKFFRGEVDKYTWVDLGSSFLPSEMMAAFLYAQLEESEVITRKRWAIFNYYARAFASFAERDLLHLPTWPAGCHHNAHMFYLVMPTAAARNALIKYLAENGVQAVFHYIPLHNSPMGLALGCGDHELPVTEDTAARIVRLPCYFELTQAQQDRVIELVETFLFEIATNNAAGIDSYELAEQMR